MDLAAPAPDGDEQTLLSSPDDVRRR